jgi:hypothetical protein
MLCRPATPVEIAEYITVMEGDRCASATGTVVHALGDAQITPCLVTRQSNQDVSGGM